MGTSNFISRGVPSASSFWEETALPLTIPFVVEFVAREVGLNRAGFANNFGGAIPILELQRRHHVSSDCGPPASSSATFRPASASRLHAQPPEAPEPTTITSNDVCWGMARFSSRLRACDNISVRLLCSIEKNMFCYDFDSIGVMPRTCQ